MCLGRARLAKHNDAVFIRCANDFIGDMLGDPLGKVDLVNF